MKYHPGNFALRGKAGGKSNKKHDRDVTASSFLKRLLSRCPARPGRLAREFWFILGDVLLKHFDTPLRSLAYCPRAKLSQRFIRRQIPEKFGIHVQRTDRDLKLDCFPQKLRSIFSLSEQVRDSRQRNRWQQNIDRPRIHFPTSHTPIVSKPRRFLQKHTLYTIFNMLY